MILVGATRVMVIVGDPIAQVKSPAEITAALQQRGRNEVVIPCHVAAKDLTGLLAGLDRMRNLDAILVTVPHKFACYRHCRTASDRAHRLEAASILRRNPDGSWHGEMLDGEGFLSGARAQGCGPVGKGVLLVGAGGAGSAIGLAFLEAGAASLAVHDTDPVRRDALVTRLSSLGIGEVVVGSPNPAGFDIVAHASPTGMRPTDPLPIQVDRLSPATFVGCVITAPAISPVAAAARMAGCSTSVGTDIFQAEQAIMLDFLTA